MSELLCETHSLMNLPNNPNSGAKGATPNGPVTVTVGEVFNLECSGESIALNPKQIKIAWKENPYGLKILNSAISPQGKWVFQVVSYKVGQYKDAPIEATDGVNTLPLKNIQFEVKSVIDPKNPPKEMFGPFGPFMTEFPWGGVIVMAVILLAIIVSIVVKLVKVKRERNLKERMKKLDHPQTPAAQLYSVVRRMEREIDFVFKGEMKTESILVFIKDLEQALKIFIVRQFQIPANEWTLKATLNQFKLKYIWLGQEHIQNLSNLLHEIEKSQKGKNVNLETQDIVQLLKNTKKWVDRSLKLMGGGGQ